MIERYENPPCRDIVGQSGNPPPNAERVPMNVHPEARERLRKLLFEPEMRAVGYSEFINRACERAEEEIINLRRGAESSKAKKLPVVPPFRVEHGCEEAAKVGGRCEHGQIVHPPSAFDIKVGESRRLHTSCPIHGGG